LNIENTLRHSLAWYGLLSNVDNWPTHNSLEMVVLKFYIIIIYNTLLESNYHTFLKESILFTSFRNQDIDIIEVEYLFHD